MVRGIRLGQNRAQGGYAAIRAGCKIHCVVLSRDFQLISFELQSKKANFDATHELEELLLEDNPLKAKKRNPNIDVSQLSADYRLMEQR